MRIQLALSFAVENPVCSFRHTHTWIDLQLLNATALVGWVSWVAEYALVSAWVNERSMVSESHVARRRPSF